ncbi:MAG: N-acetylmuramoyl-L-alanine amidase [Neomegalonema sp.]|nr:N-acetylmuramoyl-L-alanine amidase [Neomegalonema sp.]
MDAFGKAARSSDERRRAVARSINGQKNRTRTTTDAAHAIEHRPLARLTAALHKGADGVRAVWSQCASSASKLSTPTPARLREMTAWRPNLTREDLRRAADFTALAGRRLTLLALLTIAGSDAVGEPLRPLQRPFGVTTAEAPVVIPRKDGTYQLRVELSQAVDYQAFTLRPDGDQPHKLVVDLSEVRWSGKPRVDAPSPAITGLRFALFEPGRSRVAIDLTGEATIASSKIDASLADGAARLEIIFRVAAAGKTAPVPAPKPVAAPPRVARASKAPKAPPKYDSKLETANVREWVPAKRRRASGVKTNQTRRRNDEVVLYDPETISTRSIPAKPPAPYRPATRLTLAPRTAPRPAPSPRRRPTAPPLIIVIDPGHGGHDSGARFGRLFEKHIVLRVAQDLRRRLHRPGRVHVYLTRTTDRFIPLDARAAMAAKLKAKLFISLHADSLPGHPGVSGASIYTLREKARKSISKETARNTRSETRLSPATSTLLASSISRQVDRRSQIMAQLFIEEFRASGLNLIHKRPHRHAGFKVLKNFDTPSVLIELGFMTNHRDRRRFGTKAWRGDAVDAITRAVQRWIAQDYRGRSRVASR